MGLPPGETRAGAKPHSDNLGCFGAGSSSKNASSGKGGSSGRKDSQSTSNNHGPGSSSRPTRTGPVKGMELLWQPEVNNNTSVSHFLFIKILSNFIFIGIITSHFCSYIGGPALPESLI